MLKIWPRVTYHGTTPASTEPCPVYCIRLRLPVCVGAELSVPAGHRANGETMSVLAQLCCSSAPLPWGLGACQRASEVLLCWPHYSVLYNMAILSFSFSLWWSVCLFSVSQMHHIELELQIKMSCTVATFCLSWNTEVKSVCARAGIQCSVTMRYPHLSLSLNICCLIPWCLHSQVFSAWWM